MRLKPCLAQLTLFSLFQGRTFSRATADVPEDLISFISAPELLAPRYNVTVYDEALVTPGYWFVQHYKGSRLGNTPRAELRDYCDTGPMIFDHNGSLVWSGACLNNNSETPDFRLSIIDGKSYLSHLVIIGHGIRPSITGEGRILDNHYQQVQTVNVTAELPYINIHEFKIINNGRSVLAMGTRVVTGSHTDLFSEGYDGEIFDQVIREIDLTTGETLFQWIASDYLHLSDSSRPPDRSDPAPYDYLHMNSVDKDVTGDYLASGRHTNTIYKISGTDGQIIWQLGGKHSDFIMDKFNFSRQHDARFLHSNDTHTTISFLNNAADGLGVPSATTSSVYVAVLDTTTRPMRAELVRSYDQPNGGLTYARGNAQHLPNGNVFVSWSLDGYQSEFTRDGQLVMEARFKGHRYVTYRAYKANFTGNPIQPPALKATAYGINPHRATTICHVSWNGATEVSTWRFYTRDSTVSKDTLVGTARRDGFETAYRIDEYNKFVIAEALNAEGQILGRSGLYETERPTSWSFQAVEGENPIHVFANPLWLYDKYTIVYAPLVCAVLVGAYYLTFSRCNPRTRASRWILLK